jgi:hypothetical protein
MTSSTVQAIRGEEPRTTEPYGRVFSLAIHVAAPLQIRAMSERRRHERRPITELINIRTESRKDRAGLARDVSPTGLHFVSASRFEAGERLEVCLEKATVGRITVVGRVVWTAMTPKVHTVFVHSAAIEFESESVDLVANANHVSPLDIAALV